MATAETELLAKLRRMVRTGHEIGGGSVSESGKASSWGGEAIMAFVNPDGPEAAREIERLTTLLNTHATPALPEERVKLTPKFRTMSPLQKWEALVLSGLIGTDEPWIEDMRAALQRQEAEGAALRADLNRAMPDALKCEPCGAPLFEEDQGILCDDNGCMGCTPAMTGGEPMRGACFAYRSLDRTVALAIAGENDSAPIASLSDESERSGGNWVAKVFTPLPEEEAALLREYGEGYPEDDESPLPDKEAVERAVLLSWFDAMATVVWTAWCAADDSSDDFNPETHVSVPNDSFEELSNALEELEALNGAHSLRVVGTGALNDSVRRALASISPTDGLREALEKGADVARELLIRTYRGMQKVLTGQP